MKGRKDGWMDGWMEGWMDGRKGKDERKEGGRIEGRMDGRVEGKKKKKKGKKGGWKEGTYFLPGVLTSTPSANKVITGACRYTNPGGFNRYSEWFRQRTTEESEFDLPKGKYIFIFLQPSDRL
jgi:hypothetical protein